MKSLGIDKSKYPFKILVHRWVDWDGLCLSIEFTRPLSVVEKENLKKMIYGWHEQLSNIENSDRSPHFISNISWDWGPTKLLFWVHFSKVNTSALETLLNNCLEYKELISLFIVGKEPKREASKEIDIMPLTQVGIDESKYPYKIVALWQNTSATPFTINFKRPLTLEEKRDFEKIVYDYFTKGKENISEILYFLGLKWGDLSNQLAWRTEKFPLNYSTLDPLLSGFSPYKNLISVMIIGVFMNYERVRKII